MFLFYSIINCIYIFFKRAQSTILPRVPKISQYAKMISKFFFQFSNNSNYTLIHQEPYQIFLPEIIGEKQKKTKIEQKRIVLPLNPMWFPLDPFDKSYMHFFKPKPQAHKHIKITNVE